MTDFPPYTLKRNRTLEWEVSKLTGTRDHQGDTYPVYELELLVDSEKNARNAISTLAWFDREQAKPPIFFDADGNEIRDPNAPPKVGFFRSLFG